LQYACTDGPMKRATRVLLHAWFSAYLLSDIVLSVGQYFSPDTGIGRNLTYGSRLVGGILLMLTILAVIRKPLRWPRSPTGTLYGFLLLSWVLVGIYGSVVGALAGNTLVYWAGDTALFMGFPMLVYAFSRLGIHRETEALEGWFNWARRLYLVKAVVGVACSFFWNAPRMYGLFPNLLVVSTAAADLISRPSLSSAGFVVVTLLGSVLSGFRGPIILFFIGVCVALLMIPRYRRLSGVLGLLGSFLVVIVAVSLIPEKRVALARFQYLAQFYQEGRVIESASVIHAAIDDLLRLAVGSGCGSLYLHRYNDSYEHHIHVAPLALLYRYGVPGLLHLAYSCFCLVVPPLLGSGGIRLRALTLLAVAYLLYSSPVNDVFFMFVISLYPSLRLSACLSRTSCCTRSGTQRAGGGGDR
jgi:hypothetical protein